VLQARIRGDRLFEEGVDALPSEQRFKSRVLYQPQRLTLRKTFRSEPR
jgi:hypothetical protein